MGKTYEQLSLEERCAIARLREDGQSIRQIAATLDRSASTVSRELRRNTPSRRKRYQPGYADEQAWARRWRGSRLERHPDLQREVLGRLAMGWSPAQVAGRMRLEQHSMALSHESIYRFIYAQLARTKDYRWRLYLPRAKSKRGFRGRKGGSSALHIAGRIGIAQRPAEALSRTQIGHWECDLMMCSDKKHNLLVTHERTSRYTMLDWQSGKDALSVANTLIKRLHHLPQTMRQSMTFDNGTEFAQHHHLKAKTGIDTFFCDVRKPWQKGGVENMNGRLRRFLPLKTNPESITKNDIKILEYIINSTPRKCLGYLTPLEVFSQPLHFKCEFTSPLSRG